MKQSFGEQKKNSKIFVDNWKRSWEDKMPRTKPTLKLGVYGSFDINPEQAVQSFFESKIQNQTFLWVNFLNFYESLGFKIFVKRNLLYNDGRSCDLPLKFFHSILVRSQVWTFLARVCSTPKSKMSANTSKCPLSKRKFRKRPPSRTKSTKNASKTWAKFKTNCKNDLSKLTTLWRNVRRKRIELKLKSKVNCNSRKNWRTKSKRLKTISRLWLCFRKNSKKPFKNFNRMRFVCLLNLVTPKVLTTFSFQDVFNQVIQQTDDFDSFEDLMAYCDALSEFRKIFFSTFYWNFYKILFVKVLSQVEIAEKEQELIKSIELIRQKMVKSTYEAAQIVNDLNNELAELEVRFWYLSWIF